MPFIPYLEDFCEFCTTLYPTRQVLLLLYDFHTPTWQFYNFCNQSHTLQKVPVPYRTQPWKKLLPADDCRGGFSHLLLWFILTDMLIFFIIHRIFAKLYQEHVYTPQNKKYWYFGLRWAPRHFTRVTICIATIPHFFVKEFTSWYLATNLPAESFLSAHYT